MRPKLRKLRHAFLFFVVVAAFALVGCSTTQMIVSEWSSPSYASASFRRIMVGGVGEQTSIRRNFEDEFVAQLRAAGIDAVPSYRYIAEDERVDEAKLRRAAREAGFETTFKAVVTEWPLPPIDIALAGDDDRIAPVRAAIASCGPGGMPSRSPVTVTTSRTVT